MVPMFWPAMPPEAAEAVKAVLNTRWIGQGPKVDELEAMASEYFGRPCVAVNSGTAALHLALILAGVKRGDEVLSPVLTCTATNEAIMYQGATPVLCDIDPYRMCLSVADAIKKITRNTKAIMVVHLNGTSADMDELQRLADRWQIPIIEDAAQSMGSPNMVGRDDRRLTCFSFQAIKHITTADGGMLVCRNKDEADRAKRLRWFGIDRKTKREMGWQSWKDGKLVFDITEVGYKYQMNDIAAALALCAWPYIDRWLKRRQEIQQVYRHQLKGVRFFPDFGGSYWTFPLMVDRREEFMAALDARGSESSLVQIRNDLYSIFGGKRLDLPNMNAIESQYVYLPLHTNLTDEDVQTVIQAVNAGW